MSEGCCRPGRWPGSNRPPRGESRGAGTAHAQRRASALQRADHRGLSERVPVAFTLIQMLTSEGRSPLAGDFVGARSDGRPQMATGGGRAPYRPQAGSCLQPVKPMFRLPIIGLSLPGTIASGFVDKQLPSPNRAPTGNRSASATGLRQKTVHWGKITISFRAMCRITQSSLD